MASTYIPADVYNRFMNLFGNDAFLVCATDVHGVWVKRELKRAILILNPLLIPSITNTLKSLNR